MIDIKYLNISVRNNLSSNLDSKLDVPSLLINL